MSVLPGQGDRVSLVSVRGEKTATRLLLRGFNLLLPAAILRLSDLPS